MAFVLAPIESIKLNCVIQLPQDFGKTQKADVDVTWKRLKVDEKNQIIKDLTDPDNSLTDVDVLRRLILNIDGIKDPSGSDIQYNEALLEQLCQEDYIRTPLIEQAQKQLYDKSFLEAIHRKN